LDDDNNILEKKGDNFDATPPISVDSDFPSMMENVFTTEVLDNETTCHRNFEFSKIAYNYRGSYTTPKSTQLVSLINSKALKQDGEEEGIERNPGQTIKYPHNSSWRKSQPYQ
jgi:hypothetical protein